MLQAPWILIVLALAVRLATGRSAESPWRTWFELTLALGSGVALAVITTTHLSDFAVLRSPMMGADLNRYCGCIADLRNGEMATWHDSEPLTGGLLPAYLARSLGVVQGLAWTSLLATGLLGAALYLWGRALHGRLAGVSAALLAGALGPLALLPLELSFYPSFIAAAALSAAGAALALRYRTAWAVGAGSAGAGLVLLMHARGLIWALPAVGLTLLAALWLARTRPLRALVALSLPLLLSWHLGGELFTRDATLLEAQAAGALNTAAGYRAVRDPPAPARSADGVRAPNSAQGFIWGHSDLRLIQATLTTLVDQKRQAPDLWDDTRNRGGRAAFVTPVAPVLTGAAVLAVLGLARRPWQLLALLGTLVPFATSFRHAIGTDALPRFLATGYPGGAVVLGVAWVVLSCGLAGGPEPAGTPPLWRRALQPVGVCTLALLIVLGVVPTPLSPLAPALQSSVRTRGEPVLMALERARRAAGEDPEAAVRPALRARLGPDGADWERCLLGLESDAARDLPLWPSWYPQ